MLLRGGGADQHVCRWAACTGQSMEDVHPYALGSPAHEAIVERLARAIDSGCIDPAAARLQDVDDALNPPPIIDTLLAARVGWQMRHQPRELPVTQPEILSLHPWSPFGDLESEIRPRRNPVYRSGA